MKKLLFLAAFLIGLAASVQAKDLDSLYAKDLLPVGTKAPNFDLQTADGRHITLESLRGNYVVLDFWASWCPDCRKEIPAVKSLFDKYKDRNVTFVGISFDQDKEAWVKCYWETYKMTWLQVSELKKWKRDTKVDKLFKVNWIPTLYLLSPEGKVLLATVQTEKLSELLATLPLQQNDPSVTLPSFDGGQEAIDKFFQDYLEYPLVAQKAQAEAIVYCTFNVEFNGKVTGARAVKVENFACHNKRLLKKKPSDRQAKEEKCLAALKAEAVRLVSLMPNWKPGTKDGRPVQTQYTLPVVLKLKK